MIYICDKCLRACCWAGTFMCDNSINAGLYRATRPQLKKLQREHSDYWKGEVVAPRHDTATPTLPASVLRKALAATR